MLFQSALVRMGRPKKWYVTEDTGLTPGVFVNCDDGPMKLPDSEEVLGRVLDIVEPKKEKYPTEGFIVRMIFVFFIAKALPRFVKLPQCMY